MHLRSRSQFYTEKINDFQESNKSTMFLALYPKEVDRFSKQYTNLSFDKLSKIMAHRGDQRYHCLVQKISN